MWVWSLGWENPLEKGKAPHSTIIVIIIILFNKSPFTLNINLVTTRRDGLHLSQKDLS